MPRLLVFDGDSRGPWFDMISALLERGRAFILPDGSRIEFNGSTTQIIIECEQIYNMTPSIAASMQWLTVVSADDVQWMTQLNEWRVRYVTMEFPELSEMMKDEIQVWSDVLFPVALQFLSSFRTNTTANISTKHYGRFFTTLLEASLEEQRVILPVSYTHLTLPTIYSV